MRFRAWIFLLSWLGLSLVWAQTPVIHVVKPGDSLYSIGKKYGVSARELQTLNNITDPTKIKVGQRLIISAATSLPVVKPQITLPPLPEPTPRVSTPVPRIEPTRRYVFLDPVLDIIETPTVTPGRWKYIVLHHSGTRRGNARIYDADHRRRGMENGLAYHFIIGNGVDSDDGQIEVGRRWLRQIKGGHLRPSLREKEGVTHAGEEMNELSIGICFVGNFNTERPTKKQLAAALELISYLRDHCGRPASRIFTHTEMHPQHTECPGRLFPSAAFHRIFPDP